MKRDRAPDMEGRVWRPSTTAKLEHYRSKVNKVPCVTSKTP